MMFVVGGGGRGLGGPRRLYPPRDCRVRSAQLGGSFSAPHRRPLRTGVGCEDGRAETGVAPRGRTEMAQSSGTAGGMKEVFVIEIGSGADLHGQDVTKAAVRACRDAIGFNSLPCLRRLLDGGDVNSMYVRVTLGVPEEFHAGLDHAQVKAAFPYGQVEVVIKPGGLVTSSGIVLPEKGDGDGDDRLLIVNAAVEVGAPV